MSTLKKFKRPKTVRQLTNDGIFSKGMRFSDGVLDNTVSKLLVNYNIKDSGNSISPRLGIKALRDTKVLTIPNTLDEYAKVPGVHASYYGYYRDTDGYDKFANIVLSFGTPTSSKYKYYLTDESDLDSAYYNQVYKNENSAFGYLINDDGEAELLNMSSINETRLKFLNYTPKPLYTVLGNKLYCIDGIQSSSSTTKDMYTAGSFTEKETTLPYTGDFTSLVIKGNTVDAVSVAPFDIVISNLGNTASHTISVPYTLRGLPSGTADEYYLTQNTLYTRVKQSTIASADVTAVEDLTNVTLVYVNKPSDSKLYDSNSPYLLGNTLVKGYDEVAVGVSTSLDSINYVGSFTAIANSTKYIFIMAKGTTLETAQTTLNSVVTLYALNAETTSTDTTTYNLTTYANGKATIAVLAEKIKPTITYTLHYTTSVKSRDGGLLSYDIKRQSTGLQVIPNKVEANDITIAEATSLGFNMLADNPYVFENNSGLTLTTHGIMPYKPGNEKEIMLSANVGQKITFALVYDYKQGEKYQAQWEYSVYGSGEYKVIHDYDQGTYTDGAEISVTFTPEDEKFTLRCTVAPLDKDGKPDLIVSKSSVYPVYVMNNTYLIDISDAAYNLHNATGIYAYKNMLLLWGIEGAETTLFFSAPDDPSYFPFPNNIHVFDERILSVQSYLGTLLVFTEGCIYLMVGDYPSVMTVQPLYQNLTISEEDVHFIKVIKNYVFLKANGQFYLLVPNTYTGSVSDIKLVNITTPIKELLDDWKSFLAVTCDNLYDFQVSWDERTEVIEYDFVNYVKDSEIRNVFRFAVIEGYYRYQVDVTLIFDTDTSVWRTFITSYPFTDLLATGSSIYCSYIQRVGNTTNVFVQQLSETASSRKDTYNTCFYGSYDNDVDISDKEAYMQELGSTITATVERVIDGDTFVTKEYGTVRMHYVNTPEDTTKKEEYGAEATAFTSALLPEGTKVILEFEGNRTDKYNRVLAWVFLEDGTLVQQKVAEAGYVKSMYLYNAFRYITQIDNAIQSAYDNMLGIYSTDRNYPMVIKNSQTLSVLPNYQILDTGNRNQDVYYEKRYREVQFLFNNKSAEALDFYSRFYLDATAREDFKSFETVHDTDKDSPTYGVIYVNEVDTPNLTLKNTNALGSWLVDTSQFPELEVVKVILKISGKGYCPRVLLVSRNDCAYDLLGYSWVYRVKNAR